MDFWSRLIGGSYAPKKPTPAPTNEPQARLARFKREFNTVQQICNRPRNVGNEGSSLNELHKCFDRIAQLLRQETRASVPHLCLNFAATNQIYAVVARAAIVSQYEPVISSAIAVFAALVDSEQDDLLASNAFTKSLMRLVTRVVDGGTVLLEIDTETAILELLFTISAYIRQRPDVLPIWFASTAKLELEDVFVKEKKSFVGITQKDEFPLCYLLIDRIHHEGRIGDFARTGLLYIFEATGRSLDLEEWVVSSDIPTLMASSLGALYSQLSRELSILHPDATLPAVLAMSDYSTTHARATAESAFSESHRSHMATFLSYLAFWQDVLDHCRSADVKQTLLDHFQILFLRQLLYPSLLQSSDTDAGSSVAVLTYMTAILEALDYPDLIHNMLAYLLAIPDTAPKLPSVPSTPVRPSMPPRSPTAVRRRQSLMFLTAPKDPNDVFEPILFNLIDLILNSTSSENSQTVFAALKLTSTIMTRQKIYAFGTLLKVQAAKITDARRTVGALELEVDKYAALAFSLHEDFGLVEAYAGLCEDVRYIIEAQVPFTKPAFIDTSKTVDKFPGNLLLPANDPFMRTIGTLLTTFWTNSVDVNLALTQAICSIAVCIELRLDSWLALDSASYAGSNDATLQSKPWQAHLDEVETAAWSALQQASRQPTWSPDTAPSMYTTLQTLVHQLDSVRTAVPDLDQLIAGRKRMLQSDRLGTLASEPPSLVGSPTSSRSGTQAPKAWKDHSLSSSASSVARGRHKATNTTNVSHNTTTSPKLIRPSGSVVGSPPAARSTFQPPPPETPSTTDVLMRKITLPFQDTESCRDADGSLAEPSDGERTATLNHILTNVVVLQEFVLELVAILQVRAAVLGEKEARFV